MKKIILTKTQKDALIEHAKNASPNESCALLFGDTSLNTCTVSDVFLTENIEKSPINFIISNEELIRGYAEAEKKGLDVVGIFHSHPHSNAAPSETDKTFMAVNPVVWVILGKDNNLCAYELDSKIVSIDVEITS
jgi:proteasome lid subunit RPN8/RPN11